MPIAVPDVGQVDYAQGRGSKINPADTYAQPAYSPDKSLEQLGDALSGLGGKFTELASKKTAEDANARKPIEYMAEQAKKSIVEGQPYDAQIGKIYPQDSAATRGLVSEYLGVQAGNADAYKLNQSFLTDPKYVGHPELVQQDIAVARSAAATKVKDSPFYGSGYLKATNKALDDIANGYASKDADEYNKIQTEAFVNNANSAQQSAMQSAPVNWKGADESGVDTSMLKGIVQGGAAADPNTSIGHLKPQFADAVSRMIKAMPPELQSQVGITSAYRDATHQAQILSADLAKRDDGSLAKWNQYVSDAGGDVVKAGQAARPWLKSIGMTAKVATPGGSNHQFGEAMDLTVKGGDYKAFGSTAAGQWIHQNASQFGLYFPLSNESWHIELLNGRRSGGGSNYGPPNPNPDKFDGDGVPDTDTTADPIANAALRIKQAESGGNYGAQNPNTSAGGVGQFVDGTWLKEARKAGATGSDAQVLAMKKDTSPAGQAFQDKVLYQFTKENADTLQRNGIPVNPANLYAMHHAGEGAAVKILKAADGTPLQNFMAPGVLAQNHLPQSLTVGGYKQWLASKVGGPVTGTLAAQNALRTVDNQYSRVSSLSDQYRRDILGQNAVDMATKTLDTSYLDNMPPELMTPQLQASFGVARRQISQAIFQQTQQQHTIMEQQRADQRYADQGEISQIAAQGGSIDIAKYAHDPDTFEYALKMKDAALNLNTVQAKANLSNLTNSLSSAAITGDYSSISPDFKGRQPTVKELQQNVMSRTDILPSDKIALLNNVDSIINQGNLANSPDVTRYYDTNIKSFADAYDKNMMYTQLSRLVNISFAGEGERHYNGEVQSSIKAFAESHNGAVPFGQDLKNILDGASNHTRDYLKSLADIVSKTAGDADKMEREKATLDQKYVDQGLGASQAETKPTTVDSNADQSKAVAAQADAIKPLQEVPDGFQPTGQSFTKGNQTFMTYVNPKDASDRALIPVAQPNASTQPEPAKPVVAPAAKADTQSWLNPDTLDKLRNSNAAKFWQKFQEFMSTHDFGSNAPQSVIAPVAPTPEQGVTQAQPPSADDEAQRAAGFYMGN